MTTNTKNNIKNNIKPYFWGPKLWYSIFSFVAVYPENNINDEIKNSARQFFMSIENLLPCKSCRSSYSKYIYEGNTNINNPKIFDSRNNLIEFVYNLRTKVNQKREIEYFINLNYLKKKLNLMICNDDNKLDEIINNLIETPIIDSSVEKKVFKYLKKYNYNINNTFNIIKNIKEFLLNPNFNLKSPNFKLFCKRNYKCRIIINKIYANVTANDYNMIQSFENDKELHLQLLYLGCSILSKSDLLTVI